MSTIRISSSINTSLTLVIRGLWVLWLLWYQTYEHALHKTWSFLLRISSIMWPNPQETTDLVTFTEKVLNGKLHFLSSDGSFRNFAFWRITFISRITFIWFISKFWRITFRGEHLQLNFLVKIVIYRLKGVVNYFRESTPSKIFNEMCIHFRKSSICILFIFSMRILKTDQMF